MAIRDQIRDKSVLFVPVFSARSYETGTYNLTLDGNMARIVSMLLMGKPDKATVLIPPNVCGLGEIVRQLKEVNVEFVKCEAYGKNAHATRMNGNRFANFINKNFNPDDFDVLVLEPNTLLNPKYLFAFEFHAEIIYWCVASVTSKGSPWFVEEFADMDIKIANKYPTECVLQTQVDKLGGLAYVDEKGFYDPKQFDYEIIFFPFRLSDKNYHAEEVKEAICELKAITSRNFKLLYTDVNDSGLFNDDPETFVKVPSQKEVYLGLLKSRPIIPYLEDVNVLTHINLQEMLYYGCRLIMFDNNIYKGIEGISFLGDILELPRELKRRIEND